MSEQVAGCGEELQVVPGRPALHGTAGPRAPLSWDPRESTGQRTQAWKAFIHTSYVRVHRETATGYKL